MLIFKGRELELLGPLALCEVGSYAPQHSLNCHLSLEQLVPEQWS